MTTQTEKVRKLRALARSPNRHEAALALALALAKALEPKTAKAIAHAIAQLLETRGLIVGVVVELGGRDRRPMPTCSIIAATADTHITSSKS